MSNDSLASHSGVRLSAFTVCNNYVGLVYLFVFKFAHHQGDIVKYSNQSILELIDADPITIPRFAIVKTTMSHWNDTRTFNHQRPL